MNRIAKTVCCFAGLVATAAAVAGPEASEPASGKAQPAPVVCDGAKPVKLLVGLVTSTPGLAVSYGNAVICWDNEVDTEAEFRRLERTGFQPGKGGWVKILGITRLRK